VRGDLEDGLCVCIFFFVKAIPDTNLERNSGLIKESIGPRQDNTDQGEPLECYY